MPLSDSQLTTLGNRVRLARAALRKPQWKVAKAAGVSGNKVWRLENGQYEPPPAERARLAKTLRVPVTELFAECYPAPSTIPF